MTARHTLTTGEMLSFAPGLPRGFTGPVLKGVESYFTNLSFGQLVLQEYRSDFISFRNVHIIFNKPGRIICYYDYPPSLFSRVMIDNSLKECIKGAGQLYLNNEEFVLLTGSKWTGLLSADKPGEHHYIDIAWPAETFENIHAEYSGIHDMLLHITDGLPDRLKGPVHQVDTYMQRLLTDMFQLDFNEHVAAEIFEEWLQRYLNMILREAKECKSIIKKIGEDNWQKITRAQLLIDQHSGKHYTIPQISSMVGMNDYNLKKLFPIATGFTVNDYRKYWLCIKAAKMIVQRPDLPLKNFYTDAGYTSEKTFVRGFKRICFCTPGELRDEGWDVEGFL
jgi:AraC-like DNA-binding protein